MFVNKPSITKWLLENPSFRFCNVILKLWKNLSVFVLLYDWQIRAMEHGKTLSSMVFN